MPLNSPLRVERGARSKAQDRSENPNPDEESNLHGEEPISEFICSVNCIYSISQWSPCLRLMGSRRLSADTAHKRNKPYVAER
jgi:hypothetical protein